MTKDVMQKALDKTNRRLDNYKMTDRELLEFAAKAAGYVGTWEYLEAYAGRVAGWCFVLADHTTFDPLTDDGDALRLAVKLGIEVLFYQGIAYATWGDGDDDYEQVDTFPPDDTDPYAATRRAIVRAAAEIGKEMK